MKVKKKIKTNAEIIKAQRGDWGAISPVTRIIPDKRKKPPKYKSKGYDE